jgi:hypothetical protein
LQKIWRTCAKYTDGEQAAVPIGVLAQQGLSEVKQRLIVSMLERIRALRLVEREPERFVLKPEPVRLQPKASEEILQEAEKAITFPEKENLLLWSTGRPPPAAAGPSCWNTSGKNRPAAPVIAVITV